MKRSTKQNLSHGPRRVLCALLAAVFVLSLAGCGSGSASFTWFVDTIPSNLDPQVASTASDVIACENLYSGLVRKDASGKLVPALAEHWEVSSDRRTYTFTLKSGLTYAATKGAATDYAITAEDFVFAFRRMFRADTASPYAVEFSAIENSAAVLAGQLPETALGVQARGDATLVFCLSEPDENFLSKLTLPGAMPCDEDFFNSTRGTYGLSAASTLSSGSFYLYNWTASGPFLRREPSGNRVDSLRLVQNTGASGQSAAQLIANEKCSAALDETGEATSLQSISYSDTTWSLLFNCNSVFGSPPLRQALAESKRLLLPRVLSRTEMDWVEITALSQLQPGAYGILEAPASLPAFDTAHLGDGALALIPCLAASPDGVRLGRGGGYYDRFLAHYKGKRLLVCPTAALLGDLPCEGWDVRFSPHEILTEKGILL